MKRITVLVLVGLSLAACGGGGAASDAPAFGEVTVSGSLAPLDNPASDPAIGQPAPTLSGVDTVGTAVTFTPGTNATLLVFLAHWCPHCQADVPRLVQWLEQNPDRLGVDVIAVATGTAANQPNFPPGAWLDREGWNQPLILDDEASSAGSAFGLTSYPFWVAVGSDGTVLARTPGELGDAQIDALFTLIAAR